MKLVGYVRTRFTDELAEQDLEEQERGIAEYCQLHDHDLTSIVTTDGDHVEKLAALLGSNEQGIVVTDPLVLANDLKEAQQFGSQLADSKKHLFIVFHDKHISPDADTPDQQFIDTCMAVFNKKSS